MRIIDGTTVRAQFVGVFFGQLHHQDHVTPAVDPGEGRKIRLDLATKDDLQHAYGSLTFCAETIGRRASRQRREQYFTLSQSRAHFLRQAKDRPQLSQRLVGNSALPRIRGMALPGHWLAAPVEKAATRRRGQAIDDGEQMACRRRRRMNLKAGCPERGGER